MQISQYRFLNLYIRNNDEIVNENYDYSSQSIDQY